MKAVIRSDEGVFELELLSESYDEAVRECVELMESGFIKAKAYGEVISIIE